jgi:signal transduction histidine kinase
MIEAISITILNAFTFIKKHPQLFFTVILVIIIPITFIISGQQFLNAARENQETLEQERIGILHDVFASLLFATHFDVTQAQSEIAALVSKNTDIETFIVAKEINDVITPVAANSDDAFKAALLDLEVLTFSRIEEGKTFSVQEVRNGTRFWQSARHIKNGEETYYIYTETSLAHIDDIFAARILKAYFWLCGLLVIVLFLVFRHVKLIDYGYLYQETKHANEVRDLFTNMIAHELRTPLTSIRGYASMIFQKTGVDADVVDFAHKIEQSSERLIIIVTDLLDVARIQSGKLLVKNERVQLRSVVRLVVDAMNVYAKEKGISVAAEEISETLYIIGDEKRLFQALTNVISNAIKYTKTGSISISHENLSDRVELKVKDTGMGISAENQKKLFAPFFRVEGEETSSISGTGLGMWITKQLIELMKGSISVESIRGVGTHVVITLPK